MSKKSTIVILFIAIMLLSVINVYADVFFVEPVRIESEDGNKILVYNHRLDQAIPNGVYYNTEPKELIFRIEYITGNIASSVSSGCFVISDDFRHFAVIPFASRDTALAFYDNGIMLKRYMIQDLVINMRSVERTVSTAQWENWEMRSFDNINNTLSLTTFEGRTYVFDITTGAIIEGKIIEGNRFIRFQNLISLIVGIGIITCVAVLFVLRKRRKR